jgi:hypothetical protein
MPYTLHLEGLSDADRQIILNAEEAARREKKRVRKNIDKIKGRAKIRASKDALYAVNHAPPPPLDDLLQLCFLYPILQSVLNSTNQIPGIEEARAKNVRQEWDQYICDKCATGIDTAVFCCRCVDSCSHLCPLCFSAKEAELLLLVGPVLGVVADCTSLPYHLLVTELDDIIQRYALDLPSHPLLFNRPHYLKTDGTTNLVVESEAITAQHLLYAQRQGKPLRATGYTTIDTATQFVLLYCLGGEDIMVNARVYGREGGGSCTDV